MLKIAIIGINIGTILLKLIDLLEVNRSEYNLNWFDNFPSISIFFLILDF